MRAKFRWFNISAPPVKIRRQYVRLWNLFNRHTNDGEHWWGVGVLSINRRHLFFVGYCGVRVCFIGKTP